MAKTLEQLLSLSSIIANETKAGANTALRIGGLFSDIIYYLRDLDYATTSDLDARIDALVNGAPQAYDTLKEIADVLAGNVNSISDILTALGNKADKATTLSGYGITDAYTITQIDSIVSGLSGNISTLQGYFTDGVANSAAKLTTARKIWGLSFDGTADINGVPQFPTEILMNRNPISGAIINTSYLGFGVQTYGSYIAFKMYNSNGTSVTNAITINGSGNVGIGTTNPTALLYLYSTNTAEIKFQSDGTGGDTAMIYEHKGSGNGFTFAEENRDFIWRVGSAAVSTIGGGTEVMRLTNSGNMGIGTTNPQYKLDVNGEARTTKLVIGNGSIEWDETNNGFKIVGGLYTESYLSAKGANTNGGNTPSGDQYTRLDTWDGYTSAMDGWVLSAKLGKGLYDTQNSLITRVGALEGKATNVSFTQSLTSGTQIGTITIDGVTKNIYAPTIPTNLSQFTDDVVSGKYLPLSGGTIRNSVGVPLVINNSTDGGASCINFRVADVDKAQVGYENALQGTILYNYNSRKYIGVKDDGTPVYSGNTLWHSGNFTPSNYLPLSGGTITGDTDALKILRNSGGYSAITYYNTQNGVATILGVMGFNSNGEPSAYRVFDNTWRTIIHSGNIGSQSVASAAKLTTARTIWGQSFDGTGNVSGNLTMPNHNAIRWYDTNGNAQRVILLTNGNEVSICYDTASAGYLTRIGGYEIRLKYGTSYTDGFILNSSGNVGIGTTSPSSKLHLYSSENTTLRIQSDGSGGDQGAICMKKASGNGLVFAVENRDFIWQVGASSVTGDGTERMRLTNSGNVGIGTASPQYKLDVVGDVRFSSATGQSSYIYLNRNGIDGGLLFQYQAVNKWQIVNRDSGLDFYDYTRGVYALTIGINGVLNYVGTIHSTTGIYSDGYVSAKGQNTSSDMRLKNVLNEVVLSVKDIANAPSMRFSWKNGGGVDVGSSAQYWQKLLPDAVKERDGMLEMQYANIALLSAIALAKNFETHEERIARLERENKELRNEINSLRYGA